MLLADMTHVNHVLKKFNFKMRLTDEQFNAVWAAASSLENYDESFFMQLYAKLINEGVVAGDNKVLTDINKSIDESVKKKMDLVRGEISDWFINNRFDGNNIIQFELRKSSAFGGIDVVPTEPYLDEECDLDENADAFFDGLSKKHGIRIDIPYWVYMK
jgi:hypothetical protein